MTKSQQIKPKTLELGPCKQCGEQVVVAMQRGVPLSVYAKEEFCSAVCCKLFHGVEDQSIVAYRKKEEKDGSQHSDS